MRPVALPISAALPAFASSSPVATVILLKDLIEQKKDGLPQLQDESLERKQHSNYQTYGRDRTYREQIQTNRSTHITREQNQNLRNLEHLERPQNLEKFAVPHMRFGMIITLKLMYYCKRFFSEKCGRKCNTCVLIGGNSISRLS